MKEICKGGKEMKKAKNYIVMVDSRESFKGNAASISFFHG